MSKHLQVSNSVLKSKQGKALGTPENPNHSTQLLWCLGHAAAPLPNQGTDEKKVFPARVGMMAVARVPV